jgi:hypothetical protein
MKKLFLITAILFVQIQMYSQEKTKITFGGNVAYHFGTSAQKESTSPLMFFKNGQSAGLDLTLIPKKGTTRYKLAVDYIIGTNDESAVTAYAKDNNIEYLSYKYTKSNASGVSIMAGPKVMLFPKSQDKKLPLMWLDMKAGVIISNQQSVEYFLEQSTPIAEIKSKSMSFVYSPGLIVNVANLKKVAINLKASYSNYGGFGIGLNITEQDCHNVYCYRCHGSGCLPY